MKKLFTAAICCFLSSLIYSQSPSNTSKETEQDIYYQRLGQELSTLKLDLSSFPAATIDNLKDEMNSYEGKITKVEWNQSLKEMIINHNALLKKQDVFEILEKFSIKQSAIISYQ